VEQKDDVFDEIEKKSNVSRDNIFNLADSVKHADFNDKATIRQLIAQVSQMTNVPVSKEKEEKIVEAVMNNDIPLDLSSLAKMFNQPK
jgi:hypothetical protein